MHILDYLRGLKINPEGPDRPNRPLPWIDESIREGATPDLGASVLSNNPQIPGDPPLRLEEIIQKFDPFVIAIPTSGVFRLFNAGRTLCDGIIVQNLTSNISEISVLPSQPASLDLNGPGIELSPGQILVAEADNSRGLLQTIIRAIFPVRRVFINAGEWTIAGNAGSRARVWIIRKSGEGY